MIEKESCKAHRRKNCCLNCGSPFYTIYHRFQPQEGWWVECDDCGYKGYESPLREIALARWRQRHEANA